MFENENNPWVLETHQKWKTQKKGWIKSWGNSKKLQQKKIIENRKQKEENYKMSPDLTAQQQKSQEEKAERTWRRGYFLELKDMNFEIKGAQWLSRDEKTTSSIIVKFY